MKRTTFLLLYFLGQVLHAQETTQPFAEPLPDESSPFFIYQMSRDEESEETNVIKSPAEGYPRVKRTPGPFAQQISSFLAGLRPKLSLTEPGEKDSTLSVQPSAPDLEITRELNATYSVRNNSKRIMQLEFPSSQRIEILTKNATGTVLDRWSDDRSFQSEEGIVVINPRERIEFSEKIPTREMKGGKEFFIDASLATTPDFPAKATVIPR